MLAPTTGSQQVEMRLAHYYLNKLRTASVSVHHGLASIANGIELFDREWRQIEHWQAHSARRSREDRIWTRLCQDYSLAGLEVLSIRQNLADQARWLESGLQSAQLLRDHRAELTILNRLSRVCGLLGDVVRSAEFAERLMNRGIELKDRLEVGRGLYHLGSVAEDRGNYPEARRQTLEALEIFIEQRAATDEGLALYQLGSIALYQADFEKAYQYFKRHLDLMEAENNMNQVCHGLLSVAQTLLLLESFEPAEKHIRRSIRLSRELGYRRLLGAGLILLAQWYGDQGQLELELKYYQEGITAARAVGSLRDVIHGLSNLGLAHLYLGDPERAVPALLEGLDLARQAGLPRFICNLQRNLTDTYLALDNLEAARSTLKETVSLALEMSSQYQMMKALTSAIGYWHRLGIPERAANWVGIIRENPDLDLLIFEPLCRQIETRLGPEAYRQALEDGKALDLKATLVNILGDLA